MSDIKPLFANFTKFDNYMIKQCLVVDENIEVYIIDDSEILYLIKNPRQLVSTQYDFRFFKIDQELYCYFICTAYMEDLNKLWESLTIRKGFAAVAGMDDIKQELYKNVISPIKNPEKYEKFKISLPNGILLYGPTGCGKTFIVEKLAEEIDYNFLKIDHAELASPYIHDSVIKISNLFEQAKEMSPCLLFLDEIEALMPNRSTLNGNFQYKRDEINEFLLHLNNAGKNKILVIGATNNIELMDPAILRSGRFDRKIYVSAPDAEARMALFKLALSERPTEQNLNYQKLVELTENYSCSDIVHIIEESCRLAIINDEDCLSMAMIEKTLKTSSSSLE